MAGNAREQFDRMAALYQDDPSTLGRTQGETPLMRLMDFVDDRLEEELAEIDRDLQTRPLPPGLKQELAAALAWLASVCRMTPAELYAESVRLSRSPSFFRNRFPAVF